METDRDIQNPLAAHTYEYEIHVPDMSENQYPSSLPFWVLGAFHLHDHTSSAGSVHSQTLEQHKAPNESKFQTWHCETIPEPDDVERVIPIVVRTLLHVAADY